MSSNFQRFKGFYNTHSFWNGSLAGMKQFHLSDFTFDHLTDADVDLQLPQIPQGTVLGKRAEYYFQFLIEQSSNYESVVSNIQIFNDKITIGEIDFIVRNLKTDQLLHIELVYKFYIYDPKITPDPTDILPEKTTAELSKYVGPNRRDTFLKKLKRLKEHQLPLLHLPETLETMRFMGMSVKDAEQRVCFLAHIFIPREMWSQSFPYVNKQCIQGYYMDYSAFAKAETQNIYVLPHKHEWKMRPSYTETTAKSYLEVLSLIETRLKSGYASMVWMLDAYENWEIFFVIADVTDRLYV
jgi:hypothetical protein